MVPKGRLEVFYKAARPLNNAWAVNSDGLVSDDAAEVLECIDGKIGAGGILPVGGVSEDSGSHKGYGFGMICEILCAITSGGATSNHHVRRKGEGAGTCHSFIVIDPKIFGDAESIKESLSVFLKELRDAKRIDESIPIYTHGEKEIIAFEKNMREGIDVDISTVAEMKNICDYLGMNSIDYLGEVDVNGAKIGTYAKTYK